MRTISTLVLCMFFGLAAFAGVARAAGTVAPEDGSLLDLARPVLEAIMRGQWFVAAALALVLVVAGASKYGGARWAFLSTAHGKALLTLVGSFGGALATAGVAGVAPSIALAWTALKVAAVAAGGYSLIKALIGPLVPKAPSWLRPILDLVLWFFDRKSTAIASAEKAGAAAVVAKPSTGVGGIVGEPRDVP